MATIYKVKCTSLNKAGCEEEYFMDYVNAETRVTQLLNRDLDKELRGRHDIALTSIRRASIASMNKAAYWLTGRIKRKSTEVALSRSFCLETIVTKD